MLQVLGRPQDAIMSYQKAIQIRPDYAIAYGEEQVLLCFTMIALIFFVAVCMCYFHVVPAEIFCACLAFV